MAAAGAAVLPAANHIVAVTVDASGFDWQLELPATEKVVTSTPFLPWQAVVAGGGALGPATVRLSHFRAVKVFLRRCIFGSTPADVAALQALNCLTFSVNDAGWSRVLSTLHNAQLFDQGPFVSRSQFEAAYDLVDLSQCDMSIMAADLTMAGEDFDTPGVAAVAAVPAVPARRGVPAVAAVAAVPAVPAVPGPADLEFLSLLTLDQITPFTQDQPLGLFTELIGYLGPCHARATRLQAMSMVRTSAVLLAHALSARLLGSNGGMAPHSLLALNVMDLLKDAKLPICLASTHVTDADLRAELRDSLRYVRSDAERKAVEISRILFVGPR